MLDHLDARIAGRASRCGGAVARGVVDDVDPVDELRDRADRLRDQLLLVVRGHDDGNPLVVEHPA